MNAPLSLNSALYAEVTPAGAWYAVSHGEARADRKLLLHLLQQGGELPLNEARLQQWSEAESLEQALTVLYRLQRLGFVQGSQAGCG